MGYKIKILYGTAVCDYADEHGEKCAIRKLRKGEFYPLEGMYREYWFDSSRDAEAAVQMLDDFDGWNEYMICKEN